MSESTGGTCITPFLDDSVYAKSGGYTLGRFCSQNGNVTCCLPCPMDQWVYDEGFLHTIDQLGYVAIASVILCFFLALSWIVLPRSRTNRHYLSLGLTSSLGMIALSFVVPVSTTPKKCYNDITPSNMFNSKSCAVTGIFFATGCLATEAWLFLRVMWLHLRIFWFQKPGRGFTIFAFCVGILFPLVLLSVTIAYSGFSYRTSGKMCIINHENSFAVFWGWLIAFSLLTFFLQVFTSGYCLVVFLRSQRKLDNFGMSSNSNNQGRPKRQTRITIWRILTFGMRGNVHVEVDNLTASAKRQRWNQMRSAVLSQWRSFALCLALVIQCIPFVAHFVQSRTHERTQSLTECFLKYGLDDNRCLEEKAVLSAAQTTILSGLIVAALAGLECCFLTTRTPTLTTWYYILKNPIKTLYHGQYPDSNDKRKPSNATSTVLSQHNSRRRSMDDMYALGRQSLPQRSSSPTVHFRYRHSLQYPQIGELPFSYSPATPRTPIRCHSHANSRTTPSAPPSRRHSYDHMDLTPSPTSIPPRTFSRILTPLPTLALSPVQRVGTEKPLPPPPIANAPPNTPIRNFQGHRCGSRLLYKAAEELELCSLRDRTMLEERGGLLLYPRRALFEEAYEAHDLNEEINVIIGNRN